VKVLLQDLNKIPHRAEEEWEGKKLGVIKRTFVFPEVLQKGAEEGWFRRRGNDLE
jgi:hypothetical protein